MMNDGITGVFGNFPPIGAPASNYMPREEQSSERNYSVNAVSFGFVATAILISMFLVMAIFEKFLRPESSPVISPAGGTSRLDLEAQAAAVFDGKLGYPSNKMSVYTSGVSVLMPGEDIPTYIAHEAPIPCAPSNTTFSHSTAPELTTL